ncbi:universal stress protein [Blastococcus mobilis]|uniref:Nucleotide-binding universal stress protein, UspA family n=1 Tax=Blastococcus mobilis TaxID=1938746 RepID=A0A238Y8C7_9ACTN|nr:universal stress protein [Blastococcus mobilis]SNR67337.1 Nucleotide-binding universal stress protein, UspA family [Blastococcus mobilis]
MLSDREERAARDLEAALLSDTSFVRAASPLVARLRSAAGSVVVGVDTSGSAQAVEWAAAEAAGQECPLRIVHAFRTPFLVDPLGLVPSLDELVEAQTDAAQVLDDAVGRAGAISPGIPVDGRLVRGNPARVLHEESRQAWLLVLGGRPSSRSHSAIHRLLHAPLPITLAGSSGCPVAVVHGLRSDRPPPSPTRIVVGLDDPGHDGAAIAFAFRAAHRRGLGITAVHAWTPDRPADLEGVAAAPAATEATARQLLDRALAPFRADFPDVPLTAEVVRQDAGTAVIAGCDDAAMVVLACRGRGHLRNAALGRVTRAVLDGAPCPVAVVRGEPVVR